MGGPDVPPDGPHAGPPGPLFQPPPEHPGGCCSPTPVRSDTEKVGRTADDPSATCPLAT
ncbi:hypothetical protein J2S46_005029 [Kitasatospora herbaricolor]|nr:hypothetical protein [Kitasatospora herbaricolor]